MTQRLVQIHERASSRARLAKTAFGASRPPASSKKAPTCDALLDSVPEPESVRLCGLIH